MPCSRRVSFRIEAALFLSLLLSGQAQAYCYKPPPIHDLPDVIEYQGCVIEEQSRAIELLRIEQNNLLSDVSRLEKTLEARGNAMVAIELRLEELLRALTKAGIKTSDVLVTQPAASDDDPGYWWSRPPPVKAE
jgi:hypothetical protein